jgi:hypothetical protein
VAAEICGRVGSQGADLTKVCGFGFRVQDLGHGFRVYNLGFKIQGQKVHGSWSRV